MAEEAEEEAFRRLGAGGRWWRLVAR